MEKEDKQKMYFDQLSNKQESESWLKYTPKRERERERGREK